MLKPLSCKIGFHKWGKAYFSDWGVYSNTRDYKQKCIRCSKLITWVQPKGINKRYYPIYWTKRTNWILVVALLIIGFLFYKYFL
jgi:hypothetical protein